MTAGGQSAQRYHDRGAPGSMSHTNLFKAGDVMRASPNLGTFTRSSQGTTGGPSVAAGAQAAYPTSPQPATLVGNGVGLSVPPPPMASLVRQLTAALAAAQATYTMKSYPRVPTPAVLPSAQTPHEAPTAPVPPSPEPLLVKQPGKLDATHPGRAGRDTPGARRTDWHC